MTRDLSANTDTGIALTLTRPLYLMSLGFATPLRLSTRGTETYDGNVYSSAGLEIAIGGDGMSGSFVLFNEDWQYNDFIDEGGAGITVQITQLYGESPFVLADGDIVCDGELGAGDVSSVIRFAIVPLEARFSPRQTVTPIDFNHLPPDGAELATTNGIFVLRKAL